MAKRHNLIHGVEDDWMFNHSVIVEFANVLDLGNPSLVELEVVLLQPEADRLHDSVDNPDDESWVVPVNCAEENCEKMDIAVLDFARLGENLFKNGDNLVVWLTSDDTAITNIDLPRPPPSGVCESASRPYCNYA